MDGELIDQDIDSPVTLCQWSQGFYGHTEGWAVVRAGEGLLLSTSARPAQGASVARTQMDGSEAVGQLKAAHQLGDALGQSARQQGAHGLHSHEPGQAWAQHTEAMDPSARGRYAGAVGGQDARQARAGSRDLGDPVERFAQPLIHLDTPTSAAWVTPASIHLFSGQDQSISAQGDVHLTAAHTVSSVSGQTTSLYTHAGGIKAITANAGLSVRAHTDSQQVWSEQDLTVQSSTDEVRIQASKSITLTAGQSQIVIEGGNITFTCPGTWTVKGASHDWLGGGSQPAALANMPSGTVSQSPDEVMTAGQYLGKYEMFKADNRPFVGYDYEIRNSSGRVLASGKTDAAGYAQLLVTPQEEGIRAYKSVKPDSERITENWQGKLGSAAARAQNA